MYCKKCGNLIEVNENFCKKCGEPVNINNEPISASNNVMQNTIQNGPIIGNENNAMPINNQQNISSENVNTSFVNTPQNQNNTMNLNNGMVNQQANVNLSAMYQNNQNQIKQDQKKKAPFIIIVIILLVVIVGLGGMIVFKNMNFHNKENTQQNNNDNNSVNNVTDSVNNENVNSNGNIYEYKKFQLPLPNNYSATLYEGMLQLVNQVDQVATISEIYSGYTIEDINSQKEEIKTSMINSGYTINSFETKTYNETDWLIMSVSFTQDGETINMLETYCELGNYHVVENAIINLGKTSNDKILSNLSEMYQNATYNGSSQFSPNAEKEELKKDLISKLDKTLLD